MSSVRLIPDNIDNDVDDISPRTVAKQINVTPLISYEPGPRDGTYIFSYRDYREGKINSHTATLLMGAGVTKESDYEINWPSPEVATQRAGADMAAGLILHEGAETPPNKAFLSYRGESESSVSLVVPGFYQDNEEIPYKGLSSNTMFGDIVQLVARGDVNLYAGASSKFTHGQPNLTRNSINLIAGNRQEDYEQNPESAYTLEPLLKGYKTLALIEEILNQTSSTTGEAIDKSVRKIIDDILTVSLPAGGIPGPVYGKIVSVAVNTPKEIAGVLRGVADISNQTALAYNMTATTLSPLSINRTN